MAVMLTGATAGGKKKPGQQPAGGRRPVLGSQGRADGGQADGRSDQTACHGAAGPLRRWRAQ
jgi:hypothetical protein